MMVIITITLMLMGITSSCSLTPPANYRKGRSTTFYSNNQISPEQAQLDYENSICECLPYYQCNYNGTMNENGEGIIDIRSGFAGTVDNPVSRRKKCEHYLSVCCLPPEIESAREILKNPTPPVKDFPVDRPNVPPSQKPGRGDSASGVHGAPHIDRGCGLRNVNGVGFRITGNYNNEANFGEYPWMVAILKESVVNKMNVKVYKCGGSLIHKRVVLTAAHCVEGGIASHFLVRAGEWDTQTDDEPLPHQDRQVAVINIHPNYKTRILHNDYAILIVDRPFEITDNVETVCLPSFNQNYDTKNCHATGWGKDQFGDKGHYQVILKTVALPAVQHDICQEQLKTTRLGKYFKLHESFMCAGGVEKVDTCTGDGGSPLVCAIRDDPLRYVQVGIVAWGIGCGASDIPGVYADVAKARAWIDQTLKSYNIDTRSYLAPNNDGIPRIEGYYNF